MKTSITPKHSFTERRPATKTLALAALFSVFLAAPSAQATLLSYDGFGVGPGGYTAGGINGQGFGTGWDANWLATGGSGDFVVESGDIAPPTVISENGVLVRESDSSTFSASREYDATYGGAAPSVNELWSSFALQVNASRLWRVNLIGNNANPANGQYMAIEMENNTTDVNAFIRWGGSGDRAISAATFNLTLGTDYFVVSQMLLNSDGFDDVLNVWFLDGDTYDGTLPVSPTLTVAFDDDSSYSFLGINSQNPNGTADSLIFDEYRLGTTFADVSPIPEPTTASALLLGSLTLLLRRRRR